MKYPIILFCFLSLMSCVDSKEKSEKMADMIVLDHNLFDIDPCDIYGAQVLKTIVGGKVVYDKEAHGNEDFDPNRMLDRMQHE